MDFEKTDLGIDLIENAFRGSIQNTRLFSIFIFSKNGMGLILAYPQSIL